MAVWISEEGVDFEVRKLSPTEARIVLKAIADCEKMPDLHTLDGAELYRQALVAICRSFCRDGSNPDALSIDELQQLAGLALTEASPPAEPEFEAPPLSKREHSNYRRALSGALNMAGCNTIAKARKYDEAMQALLVGLVGESDDARNIRLSVREEFLVDHLYGNELNNAEGVTLGEALEGEGTAEGK